MIDNQPLVSVFLPTYNQEEYIEEAMISALEQDYENLEVVVSDDSSSDRTPDIIREVHNKYPDRLIPIYGKDNIGITGNSNRCLKHCKGKYVVYHAGDDVFLPNKIKAQVNWLSNNEDYTICYHDVDVFDSETNITMWLWSDRYKFRTGDVETIIKDGVFFSGSSVMINREHCPKVTYDESIPISSDWLFWIESLALSGGKIGYIDKIYSRYRRHNRNITRDSEYKISESYKILNITRKKYPHLKRECDLRESLIIMQEAKECYKKGLFKKSILLLLNSFRPKYGFGAVGLQAMVKLMLGKKM